MKLFSVNLPSDDLAMVIDTLKDDLTELCLDEDELLARCAVVSARVVNNGQKAYVSFELTDEQALLLMQTLIIYSERMAEAGDDRDGPFLFFARQMFTPFTGKTHYDF